MNRLTAVFFIIATSLNAQNIDVQIAPDMPNVTIETQNGPVVIGRIQDTNNEITGEFALTSRPCPNFCIQPITPAEGVTPIGELEVIAALQDPDTIVIDSRIRSEFEKGTIPGAINIPYNEMPDRLDELGCDIDFDGFNCDAPKKLVLFCNGPWCGQSPSAAKRSIKAGFPAENISYYRGGMQVWRLLGLTVQGEK